MSCDVGEVMKSWRMSRAHSYSHIRAHSPNFPSLHLRHISFSSLPLLHLRHSSFYNPCFASPTSQALHLIHLASRPRKQMVSTLYPNFPSLHLRHNSFSNLSVALPTPQLILQPFHCFTYVTVNSPTLLSLLLRHKLFS